MGGEASCAGRRPANGSHAAISIADKFLKEETMNTAVEIADVLKDAVGNDQVLDRWLDRPQDIGTQYRSLSPEAKDLLIEFFRQINLRIDARVRGDREALDRVMQIFRASQKAFNDMRWMNWIIFSVGVALVVVSVGLGITGQREVYVLLFGGMGVVSLIVYLLVRPMQGVRDALSDFLQAHITFETVNQQIGAWHPKYFMPKDIHEVQQVSDALQGIRESSARLLEHVLEHEGTELTRKGG